jgi:hypothetical protein
MHVNTTPHPNLPPQGGKESSFQSQLASLVTANDAERASASASRPVVNGSETALHEQTGGMARSVSPPLTRKDRQALKTAILGKYDYLRRVKEGTYYERHA